MAAVDFTGIWKQVKRENEDDFVQKLGIPEAHRQKAVSFPTEQDIVQEGGTFRVRAKTVEGNFDVSFPTDGTTYDAVTPGGKRQAKSFWEGSRLVTSSEMGKGTITMSRELVGEQMHMTIKCGEASMKIFYGKDG